MFYVGTYVCTYVRMYSCQNHFTVLGYANIQALIFIGHCVRPFLEAGPSLTVPPATCLLDGGEDGDSLRTHPVVMRVSRTEDLLVKPLGKCTQTKCHVIVAVAVVLTWNLVAIPLFLCRLNLLLSKLVTNLL